jgi:DNA-binding transcriptional LysR family regulator
MLDWNDLRYFLAVAREGSTLAAGALAARQPDDRRPPHRRARARARLSFLREAPGGLRADSRRRGAARPRRAGRGAANGFTDAASAQSRDVSGTVKITTEEVYAITLLAPMLRELHETHPEIMIDLDTVAGGPRPRRGRGRHRAAQHQGGAGRGLVGRQLCVDDWTLYCSRDYAARHGVPRLRAELKKHAFIGGGGGNLWIHYQAWLQRSGWSSQVAMHHATSGGCCRASARASASRCCRASSATPIPT